jgi:ABC-type lipoprotein export system ATPase subunit
LAATLDEVRAQAWAELERRRDVWQPLATQLAAFLPLANKSQLSGARVTDLKTAANWVAEEIRKVRDERFAPIAARVLELWHMLRQSSNVELEDVRLGGTKTRRRLDVQVTVDDVEGAALSVMSQGELHALALSLFLPRATQSESPFKFIVIDDPVQSMDASRVDGLAQTLADVAKTHQVVIFTHDERLPDACRRLRIDATVLEVTRGPRSQVTVRTKTNPVDDYIADARAILATRGYPVEARRRVVPGLCRNALEAACIDATRRLLLERGVAFEEIEQRIEGAQKLLHRMALALFGDTERAGDVLGTVNRKWGGQAGDCVKALNRGVHELVDDYPDELVRRTEQLAHAIGGTL